MTKITNTLDSKTGGARGVETETGTVYVEPGETVDVEVKKGHKLYPGLEEGEAAAKKAAKAQEAPAEAEEEK